MGAPGPPASWRDRQETHKLRCFAALLHLGLHTGRASGQSRTACVPPSKQPLLAGRRPHRTACGGAAVGQPSEAVSWVPPALGGGL